MFRSLPLLINAAIFPGHQFCSPAGQSSCNQPPIGNISAQNGRPKGGCHRQQQKLTGQKLFWDPPFLLRAWPSQLAAKTANQLGWLMNGAAAFTARRCAVEKSSLLAHSRLDKEQPLHFGLAWWYSREGAIESGNDDEPAGRNLKWWKMECWGQTAALVL